MSLDFNQLNKAASGDEQKSNNEHTQRTPDTSASSSTDGAATVSSQSANTGRGVKKYLPYVLTAVIAGGFAYGFASKDKPQAPSNAEQTAQADKKDELPKVFEPKKLTKLPFDLPKHFQGGEVVDVLDFGNFYLVGTKKAGSGDTTGANTGSTGADTTGVEYLAITKDGKFTLLGMVIQNDRGQITYNVNGRIPDDQLAKGNIDVGTATGQADVTPTGEVPQELQTQSYLGDIGMKADFFSADLTKQDKYYRKSVLSNKGAAIGDFKTDVDLFARHAVDTLYNAIANSDTSAGKYKDAPHVPVYVFYDPRCPYCQEELPKLEAVKEKGYDFIYVPTAALSSSEKIASADDTLLQRVLDPVLGRVSLKDTLNNDFKATRELSDADREQMRQMVANNTGTFTSLPSMMADYYGRKYGGGLSKYGVIGELAVPSMAYIDRNSGELKFSDFSDASVALAFGELK